MVIHVVSLLAMLSVPVPVGPSLPYPLGMVSEAPKPNSEYERSANSGTASCLFCK